MRISEFNPDFYASFESSSSNNGFLILDCNQQMLGDYNEYTNSFKYSGEVNISIFEGNNNVANYSDSNASSGAIRIQKFLDVFAGVEYRVEYVCNDHNYSKSYSGVFGFIYLSSTSDKSYYVGNSYIDLVYGSSIDDNIKTMSGNDYIEAGSGSDIIDGGSGGDRMLGGIGDDIYYVDNANDVTFEFEEEGIDIVSTKVSYELESGSEIESYRTTNSSDTIKINLIGNEFAQSIVGNNGANTIDGKGDADTMRGYGGNDTYYVDNADDQVFEAAEGGTDRLATSVSFTLARGQHIETLSTASAAGTTTLKLTGNEKSQSIVGNNGANTIDGKEGADLLRGYGGKDSFLFTTKLGSSNVDRIQDFSAKDDTIALENAIFTALTRTGTLSSAAFKDITDGARVDANDRILYNHDTGMLSYDADGSGAKAAITFAILDKHPTLTFQDFTVV